MIPFKIGQEYSLTGSLDYIFQFSGVTPKRSAEEYAQLIRDGKMRPFVWDGPSTPMGGRFLALVTFSPGFPQSIRRHSFRHDVEHWLGDESGTTRDASNMTFRRGMERDG